MKSKSRSDAHYRYIPGLGNEYGNNNNKKSQESEEANPSGRNVSTLQIVFIITMIMGLGYFGYYFIQFYPIFCSKESKYDVMSSRRSFTTPIHSTEFEETSSNASKSTHTLYSNEQII